MSDRLSCDEVGAGFVIERYVAGTLSEPETGAFEEHLLTCERCQQEIPLAVAIREALPAVKAGRTRRPAWFRTSTITVAAAAVLAGVLLISRDRVPDVSGNLGRATQEPPSGLRDAEITAAISPTTIAPIGPIEALGSLVWTAVPQAEVYEVTLFGADAVVWESRTRDTFVVVPDSVRVSSGVSYYWQVRARIGWDRWSQSQMAEFAVVPPRDSGR